MRANTAEPCRGECINRRNGQPVQRMGFRSWGWLTLQGLLLLVVSKTLVEPLLLLIWIWEKIWEMKKKPNPAKQFHSDLFAQDARAMTLMLWKENITAILAV